MPKSEPTAARASAPSDRRATPQDSVFAALDLGTNNCRLLVARPAMESDGNNSTLKVLDSFSRIVRLGEGLSSKGELSSDAMERTMSALRVCKKKLERFEGAATRFVATEACRQASNSKAFLKQVKDELDLDIKIISTEEEAKLAFMGCATLLAPNPSSALVFDIGGGSTEFMWASQSASKPFDALNPPRIKDWFSLNQGVMNLSEKFGGPQFADLVFDDMVSKLAEMLEDFDSRNGINESTSESGMQMLSTSGTVTTLAAIHLGLPRYERSKVDGIKLSAADLRKALRSILKMRPSERFSHPCIGPDRSDYIVSGCAIFEAICTVWEVETITIADRGVREGIIISLMKKIAKSS
jgi:exopolyphosphatase/guanosine-5'-triphosphate,3'-diphosphate pyrophosphatase